MGPSLEGWATARVLARRLGCSPETVRRRAARGLLEALPNPLGSGAIYRAHTPARPVAAAEGGRPRRTAGNPRSVAVRRLRSGDGAVLACLPCTTSDVAAELGLRSSSAMRVLERLEREGFAVRDGVESSGPRGGRPSVWWRPVRESAAA